MTMRVHPLFEDLLSLVTNPVGYVRQWDKWAAAGKPVALPNDHTFEADLYRQHGEDQVLLAEKDARIKEQGIEIRALRALLRGCDEKR